MYNNLNTQFEIALFDYIEFFDADKKDFQPIFQSFGENQNLQNRKNMTGHLATQGFLFNSDFSKVLLLHHKGLNRW